MKWPTARLGDVALVQGGRTPKGLDRWLADNPRSDRDIPFFKVGDMNAGSTLRKSRTLLARADLNELRLSAVAVGSVVFPKAGGAIATNKKRSVEMEGPVDLNCMAVTPGPHLDERFLRLWFESFDLTTIADGSILPQISKRSVSDLKLPLPSLDEQRRIVDLLEDRFSRLDAAEAYLRAAGQRLTVIVKSILLSLIPGESDYPTNWKRSTVDEAGHLSLGRQRHPDWHTGPTMKPYLRVANVFEDRIDTSDVMEMHWPDDTFDRFKLEPGDVLLNEGQSPHLLGRPAVYRGIPSDVAFTNSLLRFKAHDGVLPEFALLVFRRHMHAGRFARESRITTNIAHLSARRLKPIEFPIPPVSEQRAVVDAAREQLDSVARIKAELKRSQTHALGLRRSLLAAAFSGRLTGAASDVSAVGEMIPA